MEHGHQHQPSGAAELTANIISAYVSRNRFQASELPALIASVHAAVAGLGSPAAAEPVCPEKPTPAQIRKSITPDALISFLDGKPYKMLKRHLTGYGLTIEGYKARYGLPPDYPTTSTRYSAQRSDLARSFGLGQKRRKSSPVVAGAVQPVAEVSKARGRPRKAAEPPMAPSKARSRNKVAEPA